MNKLKFICLFILVLSFSITKSQNNLNNPLVLEIEDEKIYLSEFLDQFNMSLDQLNSMSQESINEYLDLYLNFKLKIKEGQYLGLDTVKSFLSEFKRYRDQVASRYLYDNTTYDSILNEMYDRSKYTIKAKHILVALKPYAINKDTLAAYNKAIDIRNRILLKGEVFEKLAEELSDDSTARRHFSQFEERVISGNRGNLDIFGVFSMPVQFEDFCYTAPEGVISMPIRTELGYHIIYLEKRIPFYGRVTIDHIWIAEAPSHLDSLRAKTKIDEAYKLIKRGEDFNQIAKQFSEDQSVKHTEGRVASVGINNMIPEYVIELSKLDTGQFSKPFHTPYGWHIVRLVTKEDIPPIEDILSSLEYKIERSGRKQPAIDILVEKLKKEYNFTEVKLKEKKIALDEITNQISDDIYYQEWKIPKEATFFHRELFSFNKKRYTQKELLEYIEANQFIHNYQNIPLSKYTELQLTNFINNVIINFADSLFEKTIPELNKTISTFYDGLLVYAFNEKEIWNKAILDTTGLENFYESTKINHYTPDAPESNPYMWSTRVDATKWILKSNNCFSVEKVNKTIQKSLNKKVEESKTYDNIIKLAKKNCRENENLVEYIDELIDFSSFEKNSLSEGTTVVDMDSPENGNVTITAINEIIPPQLKQLSEAKGYYINDYQVFLEEKSNNSLKNKYSYKIHFEAFQ